MSGIYYNGTDYVTNQRLKLETLKKLNDSKHVLEVESFQGLPAIGTSVIAANQKLVIL